MKNYNPSNSNTLQFQQLELKEFSILREFCLSKINSIISTDAVIGDLNNNIKLRLRSNFQHLTTFWKLNFITVESDKDNYDGELIFLEYSNDDILLNKYNFKKYKYYNLELNSIISINNDFYGNVKISYRAISSNAFLKENILALHSSCLFVQNKSIAITGDSGSGKSTLFNSLYESQHGVLIWEDFGFVKTTNAQIVIPNEIYNHLNHRTAKFILNSHEESSNNYFTEFFEIDNPNFNERRIMVNLSDHFRTIQNTQLDCSGMLDVLVIVINEKSLPFFMKRVSAGEAINTFAKVKYSKAHQVDIRYGNGSLILNKEQSEKYYQGFESMFENIKNVIILNNIYEPINPEDLLDYINLTYKHIRKH